MHSRQIPYWTRFPLLSAIVLCTPLATAQAAIRTVLTLNDSGAGSLRGTISIANAGDSIVFAVAGTITLTSGELLVDKNITIDGPGANVLTIARSTAGGTGAFRIFNIANGTSSGPTVTISGVMIANGVIFGNGLQGDGGGLYNNTGNVTLTGCDLSRNSVTAQFGRGGGIFNHSGQLLLINCTFDTNSARATGGAIFNDGTNGGGAGLTLSNCTLYGNSATSGGGGIFNDASGGTASLALNSCTLAFNSASQTGSAGGIENVVAATRTGNAHLTLRSTIVKKGVGPNLKSFQAVVTSNGYNLSDDDAAGLLQGQADQTDTDPKLDFANLQDNGGGTKTIALLEGSPALDRGNSGLTTDQRGHQRPIDLVSVPDVFGGDGSDIGAYEADDPVQDSSELLVNVTNNHDDGVCGIGDCTLREAVNRANILSGPNTINFAANVTGTISFTVGLGALTVSDSTNIVGPGARVLAVSAATQDRIFVFTRGTSTVSGLTLRDGFLLASTGSGGSAMAGGILNQATLTLNDSALINNRTGGASNSSPGGKGGDGFGGGIYNSANLTVNRCTFSGNQAFGGNGGANPHVSNIITSGGHGGVGLGGGIYNDAAALLTINNSTFSSNTGGGGTGGSGDFGGSGGEASGAIFNQGTLNCTASTLSANIGFGGGGGTGSDRFNGGSAGSGSGGLTASAGTTTVRSTISAGNSGNFGGGPDADGTFTSQGYNLIGNADFSTGFNATGDEVGTSAAKLDANLGLLGDNGGPTDTMALLDNSPALDAGTSFGLTTDQRNSSRPVDALARSNATGGDGSDIGAFEKADVGPTATPTPAPTPTSGRLTNISTRAFVDLGDNVMIGGFTISGSGNKTVLIRAVGPSLANAPFSLGGSLQDPTLSLFNSSQVRIDFNDNWSEAANVQAIDPALRPTDARESAILTSLPPGAYTAIVSGVDGGTGIGLVELFDLDATAGSKLSNISTRGLVETGDRVLIGGFIVKGPDSQNVVIRAIGPSLADAPFNLTNALQNPTVSLFNDQGGRIQSNDDWQSDQQAEIIATGLQPSNLAESALVRTLTPGNYTAIVTAVNGTIGIALVEVYGLN